MMRRSWAILGILLATAAQGDEMDSTADCVNDAGPQGAVVGYITAMKEKRFEDAYNFVTPTMTDGASLAEWAALQRRMFELGGVTIGEIDVRAAQRDKLDAETCAPSAKVPNILRAGDILNNQGSTEFEVYTVLLHDGTWRIDSQETLFDEPAIHQWFPGEEIPEFEDTADPPQ